MDKKILKKIKGKVFIIHSAYKDDKFGNPINNLNDIAVKGSVTFYQKHDPFFGKGDDYKSRVVKNATWLKVLVLANQMIKITGDKHHIFLEGVSKKGKKATFIMGS
jgi:hypothetical protein